MKHVRIVDKPENSSEKYVEAGLTDNRKIYLVETEYSQEELEEFCSVGNDWMLLRDGRQTFLSETDGGEDDVGYYSAWFDLMAERAVFDKGVCVGVYLCPDSIHYSGRGRASFGVENWGYPGYNPFTDRWAGRSHVFLFSNAETHKWNDWTLLKREFKALCTSTLKFF